MIGGFPNSDTGTVHYYSVASRGDIWLDIITAPAPTTAVAIAYFLSSEDCQRPYTQQAFSESKIKQPVYSIRSTLSL